MLREAPVRKPPLASRRTCLGFVLGAAAVWLGACAGGRVPGEVAPPGPAAAPAPQAATPGAIGSGNVKIALILPLTAPGNAGLVAQSMRNAADMALAEFKNPDIQILVKDSGGSGFGAQAAAQQALGEGAELILGPLFAQSVAAVGQVARARGVPVIAFSTDTSVAAHGVYLLSFLPESEVNRITDYAVSRGKRSFAAMMPNNAYGSVVEAAFKQEVGSRRARILALERYPADKSNLQPAIQQLAQAARQADALFVPDSGDAVSAILQGLTAAGTNVKRLQLLGTGIWEDDPRIFSNPAVQGGWFAAPESAGFKRFVARYRQRFGQDPIRTATLAYDAVALVAALVKTQGAQRFSEQVLTNGSGFAGIDGVFRFRPDGTNQRELAVLRVTPKGGQVISPAPKTFEGGR